MYIFLQATGKKRYKCKIVNLYKRRAMFCTVPLYPECRESHIRPNMVNPDSVIIKPQLYRLNKNEPLQELVCLFYTILFLGSFDNSLVCFGYGKNSEEQKVKIVFVGPASVVVSADRDIHLVLCSIFLVYKSSASLNCGKETSVD